MTRTQALANKVRLRESLADLRKGTEQNVVQFPIERCRIVVEIEAPFVTDPLPPVTQ